MKFWDREKEKEWLKRYLQTEPNAILFVYGPKSSGKTTLLMKVVKELSEGYKIYWYDLRGKVISSYDDVLGLFFREKGWSKKFLEGISKILKINFSTFEMDTGELAKVLKGERDALEVMERELGKDVDEGKKPVIVFDELQKLKEIYLNGDARQRPLVRELFNFFVRVTKVLHLAHVIVMTSDTFFIDQVYTDSTLKNTSEFYLVDFFDDETAKEILISEGLSEEKANYVVEWIGGVPWMMERVLTRQDPIETIKMLYRDAVGSLKEILGRLYEMGVKDEAMQVLKKVLEGKVDITGEDRKMIKVWAGYEVLFYDPVSSDVRFQTKLDERAAEEILENMKGR